MRLASIGGVVVWSLWVSQKVTVFREVPGQTQLTQNRHVVQRWCWKRSLGERWKKWGSDWRHSLGLIHSRSSTFSFYFWELKISKGKGWRMGTKRLCVAFCFSWQVRPALSHSHKLIGICCPVTWDEASGQTSVYYDRDNQRHWTQLILCDLVLSQVPWVRGRRWTTSIHFVLLKDPLSQSSAPLLHSLSIQTENRFWSRSSESFGARTMKSVNSRLRLCTTVNYKIKGSTTLVTVTWETRRETAAYRSQVCRTETMGRFALEWKRMMQQIIILADQERQSECLVRSSNAHMNGHQRFSFSFDNFWCIRSYRSLQPPQEVVGKKDLTQVDEMIESFGKNTPSFFLFVKVKWMEDAKCFWSLGSDLRTVT